MANPVGKVGFKLVSTVVGIPIGIAASRGVEKLWKSAHPDNPPTSPTDPTAGIGDALGWAAISAAGVALAQLVTYRSSASVWRTLTGSNPPAPKQKKDKKAAKAELEA